MGGIYVDLDAPIGGGGDGSTVKVNGTTVANPDFIDSDTNTFDNDSGDVTVNNVPFIDAWVSGSDYLKNDQVQYNGKVYIAQERINDGRTTTPDMDAVGWLQAGGLTGLPNVPAATTTTTDYSLRRTAAVPEEGVTISFTMNATDDFDQSYIGGFPADIANFTSGRNIEFGNYGFQTNRVGDITGTNNLPGVRISVAEGNSDNTLAEHVAEWVALGNADPRLFIEFAVNALDNTRMDIFYSDVEQDINPANIVKVTMNNVGITIDDDFVIAIIANAPEKIVEAPEPVWIEASSGGGGFAPDPSGGTAGQIIIVNAGETDYEFGDLPTAGTPSTFDVVDWMTLLVQGKVSGTQSGVIGSTGFSWVKQVTYRTGTYFRVTGTDLDGWYIDTTTSSIGTKVPNATREK